MNTKKGSGEGGETKKWEIEGSKGKVWTVQTHKKYGLSCNCPSWIYKLKDGQRGCKHTNKVLAQIGGLQTRL